MLTKNLHDTVLDIVKIRAVNYRLTSDEFDSLFDYVYRDITSTITTKKVDIEVTVTKGADIYLDAPEEYILHNVIGASEKDSGDDVLMYFKFDKPLAPELNDDCLHLEYCGFFDIYGASPVVVFECTASTIPQNLDERIVDLLVPVVVEGILYNTESYIPSGVDAQIANVSMQRYYSAKKQLEELLPQGV